MATALNLDQFFDAAAYRAYLAGVTRDASGPSDPVERMLLEQLCLAHFRVAQLPAAAGQAAGAESGRHANAAAARLLGEPRLTALALRGVPRGGHAGLPQGRGTQALQGG